MALKNMTTFNKTLIKTIRLIERGVIRTCTNGRTGVALNARAIIMAGNKIKKSNKYLASLTQSTHWHTSKSQRLLLDISFCRLCDWMLDRAMNVNH